MKIITTQANFCADYPDLEKKISDKGWNLFEVEHEKLAEYMKDADGLLVGTEKVPAELIRQAKRLKVISRYGIGYDAIDLKAASEQGIIVTNAPGSNANAVAELTLMGMLYCSRNVFIMNSELRKGKRKRPLGTELSRKKVGIIGVGTIGKIVAKRCGSFGMEVWCNDIENRNDFIRENGFSSATKEEIYQNCDIITVHTPKTPLTDNLITAEQISMMKDGVILINLARGGIINESDLYDALVSGKVRAAALDVAVIEPPFDNPLVQLDNCLFTPHGGASTVEAYRLMHTMAVDNLIEVLETRDSRNRVN